MPRDIVLGNGNLLINFDHGLNMRDLYYPFVGLKNHIMGHRNRLGVWTEGCFSWIDENCWQRKVGYKKDTLVSESSALNSDFGVELEINDAVHYRENIFLKKITIKNLKSHSREVRIFLSHDFSIDETDVGDTAFYDPNLNTVCHYKRNRYFLINGLNGNKGIFQYSLGIKRFGGAEGTWRDAEDGCLSSKSIADGSVDSTVSFSIHVEGNSSETLYYWIIVCDSYHEAREINNFILEKSPGVLIMETETYWNSWVNKIPRDFGNLSEKIIDLFKRSLLVIRTQIDNGGAILAANDTDILMFHRDHYSYLWPRDGALVAYSLDMAGYPEVTANFYRFCSEILTEGGYLLQRYNPDGTPGSTWHPLIFEGKKQAPIQEDETALVLFALGHFYELYKDIEFVHSLYPSLIVPAADFLADYRDPVTGLPIPSYDLWEERRGIFTFTTASVYGGLKAAAGFAGLFGDRFAREKYEKAAHEIKIAMEKYLYSQEVGRFLRGLYLNDDGTLQKDYTFDSSIYGLFEFGAFNADDPRVVHTMQAIEEELWVKTDIGGMARYTGDYYFKKSDDIERVPGNPWFICTLWLAEWYIAKAKKRQELEPAYAILEWAAGHTLESGLLSEQIHPYTGEPISVSPLTWSHSTYVLAVVKYLQKYFGLGN